MFLAQGLVHVKLCNLQSDKECHYLKRTKIEVENLHGNIGFAAANHDDQRCAKLKPT